MKVQSAIYDTQIEKLYVTASAKAACPVAELGKLVQLIQNHKIFFVPLMCFIGLVYAFYGLKIINMTFFVSGMALGSALVMLFCLEVVIKRES